jgi:hypothetical protein
MATVMVQISISRSDSHIFIFPVPVANPRSRSSRSHSVREIIVGSHVADKNGQVVYSLSKTAFSNVCGKGLEFRKRIGILKSSSVYKSNNRFETCSMAICR